MKWISHQIVTGALVYLATDSPLWTVCSMAGAVLPDRLEGSPQKARDYWSWRSSHRGWSHWPAPYLFALALTLPQLSGAPPGDWVPAALMAGALLHILEDAVCGKVPLIFPGEKIGIKLFKVGSFAEYFFAAAVVLIAYGVKRLLGS